MQTSSDLFRFTSYRSPIGQPSQELDSGISLSLWHGTSVSLASLGIETTLSDSGEISPGLLGCDPVIDRLGKLVSKTIEFRFRRSIPSLQPLVLRFPETTNSEVGYRFSLILDPGVTVTLVEDWDQSSNALLALGTLELGDGSDLNLCRVVHPGSASTLFLRETVLLGDRARLRNETLMLSGKTAQIRSIIQLQGVGSQYEAEGLALGDGLDSMAMAMDVALEVHHQGKSSESHVHWTQVMDGESVGTFNGVVRVHSKAAGSKSLQKSRALLMNPKAQAHSLPKLEIETDDVQCSHGAVVSPLDPELVFFLQSRGLTQDEAEAMIRSGFVWPVIQKFESETLRSWVERLVATKVKVTDVSDTD